MGYYDLERAARDLNYRIMYEHQQRVDKDAKNIADMLARSKAQSASPRPSSATSDSGFSFSSSPGSNSSSPSGSGGLSSSASDGDAIALLVGLFAFPVIIGVILIANYWLVILKWAGIAVMLLGSAHLLMERRRDIRAWVAAPIIWLVTTVLVLVLHDDLRLPNLIAFTVAITVGLSVGTAIWPAKDGDGLGRFLGALCWLCVLGAFVGAAAYAGPMAARSWGWDAGQWVGTVSGITAACLTWGLFHPLRRVLHNRGNL